MAIKLRHILCLSLLTTSWCTPVDDYVESFVKGIGEMKKIADEYKYEEENFIPAHYNVTDSIEYDFIIVGSGPSGAALANRLSEVPEWKILLLEAGYIESPISQIPAMAKYLQTTPYDWRYTTTEQKHSCLGMENQKCSLKYGKCLGGTSSVDDMLYTRGNQNDYDKWADLDLKGWCWNDVLPYFLKIEDAHIPELDRKLHKLGGPVHLELFRHSTPLSNHVLEAGHELGIKTVDYNGKVQLGLAVPQATTKDGRRNSVAQSYLGQAVKRHNLEIRSGARAVEILISPHTKEANGVKFVQEGHLFVAKAKKEVILAAGAINTAQLLMLSGIGPKEDLEALKINPVCDLKVGQNLKDQVSFVGLNFLFKESSKQPEVREMVQELLGHGKGPLTTPGIEAVGFLKTEASKDKLECPDIELLIRKDLHDSNNQKQKSLRIKKEIQDELSTKDHDSFNIEITLLHPKSTGNLKLHDADPLHHPLINPNSLTDPDDSDVETLLAGVKKALKLAETESMKKLGVHLSTKKVPGCDQHKEDDYWKCAIRHLSTNKGQITGTARMGTKHDKETVVDEHLKVLGVHKLRVADASVIPVTISGNLVAPSIMIGERAAHLIKEDWK